MIPSSRVASNIVWNVANESPNHFSSFPAAIAFIWNASMTPKNDADAVNKLIEINNIN
jgi:hypothetical protein